MSGTRGLARTPFNAELEAERPRRRKRSLGGGGAWSAAGTAAQLLGRTKGVWDRVVMRSPTYPPVPPPPCPLCQNRAPVRPTRGGVAAACGTVSYFALYRRVLRFIQVRHRE